MALIKSTEMMHVWRRIALLAAAVCMAMVSTMPSSMAATAASPVASKYLVDVRVFFRAFCPACQWFVGDPLLELIRQEEFRNIVNLNVYPAAGMMEKNGVFDCEGGELECEGHQWEVCIIEKDKDDVVKYLGGLACIEGDESGEIGEWETKLQNCFTAAERATLKECYDKRSADILRKMMKAERFDAVEWMPYTLVSGKVLGSASTGVGLSDLQTNVCLSYKGPKKYYPDMCQQLVGAQKQVAPDDEPVVATTAPAAVAANADNGATPKPAAQAEKKDDIAAGNEAAEAEADGDEMDLPMKGDEDVKGGDANKIRLDLYWRAFCPGCRGFITKPLRKLLGNPEFRKIVDFHPVPAAGTQMDKDGNFMCTKGVVECQGHRWLSCAVNEFPKVEELIVHLACLEDPTHKGSKWSAVVGKCFSTEDAKKMRTCYEDKSRSLLAKFIEEREKIEVQWVPYVLLDSVVIGDARHGIGYKQLQEEVCRAYKGTEDARPTACQPKRLRQDEEKEDTAKATEKVIKPCPPKKETAKPAEVDKDAPGAGFRRPLKQSDPIADAQREVADREAAEVARGLENAAKANAAAAGGDASTGFSFSSLLFPLGCFAVVGLVARRLSGDHKKDA